MDFDSLQDDNVKTKPMAFDSLKEDKKPVQFDDLQDDGGKYSTPGQQIGAGVEGLAQGFAGPLATGAELGLSKLGVPGLSAEEQAGRAAANPWIHGTGEAVGLGAGLLTGTGEAALIAHAVPEIEALGKVGSLVFKGAVENAALAGGSEVSKHLLNQVDPGDAVSNALMNVGGAALLGGAIGGVTSGVSQKLRTIENEKAGTKMQEFLAGIAENSKPGSVVSKMGDEKAFKAGKDFIPDLMEKISHGTSRVAAGKVGLMAGAMHPVASIPVYEAVNRALGPVVTKLVGKNLTPSAQKAAYPVVIKMLSSGETSGLFDLLDHAADMNRGAQKANMAIGNLFKLGAQRAVDEDVSAMEREKIKDHLENGGIQGQLLDQHAVQSHADSPPAFAKGGLVKAKEPNIDALGQHYPEQAVLMAAAKGRVSNYLNSLRPVKNPQKLPYDSAPNNGHKEKIFNRAVDIAAKPLLILNKVKAGTVTMDDMRHFAGMYPDVHDALAKRITAKITQQQMDGEKPHYRTRQGLSVFLGTPLDSTMTSANIRAAQSVFIQQKAAQVPQKGTAKMGEMSKSQKTSLQGAEERQVEKG